MFLRSSLKIGSHNWPACLYKLTICLLQHMSTELMACSSGDKFSVQYYLDKTNSFISSKSSLLNQYRGSNSIKKQALRKSFNFRRPVVFLEGHLLSQIRQQYKHYGPK